MLYGIYECTYPEEFPHIDDFGEGDLAAVMREASQGSFVPAVVVRVVTFLGVLA